MVLNMADRNNLRLVALFTLILISDALNTAPMRAVKREMRPLVHEVLKVLRKESICKPKSPTAVHTIRSLTRLKIGTSDCEQISIFGTYFTEATDLDIHTTVTERLQAINQYLQSFQKVLCKTEPAVKDCGKAFEESDGDYEKVCKVMSLLKLLTKWLSR